VGMKIGLKRLGIPYLFVSCRPTLNLDTVVDFQPDLIVYGLLDIVKNRGWRKEIRERLPNATIVLWYGDYRDGRMIQLDADCSEMDAMFVSNDAQETHYKQKWNMKAVHFLPLGCEPSAKPVYNDGLSYPFVFLGGIIPTGLFHERAQEIEHFKIQDKLTVINSYDPELRGKIYRLMPAIYSSSKVALDISHFTNIKKYTSIRYWEIPAYFGFALTKRFPGCEQFYPEDTRVYFDTHNEAIEKKDYYLTHEKERVAMLTQAHELSYNHTYDKRFATMFSLL
jgi:hypothetical protein